MPWQALGSGTEFEAMSWSAAEAEWIDALGGASPLTVAIVGGAGRLGSWLTTVLSETGHRVRILDTEIPAPRRGVEFVAVNLARPGDLAGAFAGADAVVHLAAVHGAHLVAGRPRQDFWRINVRGTHAVLRECARGGVRRVVVASSTSVYGPGTEVGRARVLDERTTLAPEDVYDYTKVATERLLARLRDETGVTGTALRFGRFFYPSERDYQLRKLSTGLDILDACQAVVRVLLAPRVPLPAYCVASDLALSVEQRERLGIDLPAVLEEQLPGIGERLGLRGVPLPARVGKSVDTAALRRDLGYLPSRTIAAALLDKVSNRSLPSAMGGASC